jgi:hypothetical protein
MNLDDVFIPYLLNLFSSYLEDIEYSVQDAQDKGSDFFVEWLADFVDGENALAQEGEEDEERTPDQDAFYILTAFLESEEQSWIDEFWSVLLLAHRGAPHNRVAEFHTAYVVRWQDGKVFSYICTVPPNLVSPRGLLSDFLVTKVAHISSAQFHDMVSERSLDVLHDVQQSAVSKEALRCVLDVALAEIHKEKDFNRRLELESAVHFLRSLALPLVPPSAEKSARRAMPTDNYGKGRWDVLSVDPQEE